ncbi:MAG: MFS transporter [Candidatus Zixiibacteriota bacterium]|nr:MAG: MFS transporter [candidate division Zixibacteria bacterium]
MSATVTAAAPGGLKGIARDYWNGLRSLFTCPHEIWVAYAVKILESLAYFSSVLMLMIFLTQDLGLSDEMAGTIFGVWSASMSFFMLFVGFIADSLGIKKALLFGLGVALLGRLAITFTLEPWVVYPGLFLLSVGFAYMIPLLAAAVKLFSNKRAQQYAFSWYYVVMNVGSLAAGLALDPIRAAFTEVTRFQVLGLELLVRPTQIIFLVSVLSTLVSLGLVFFLIRKKVPREEDEVEASAPAASMEAPKAPPADKERRSVWQVMKEVGREKTFWIFISFIFLLVLVKMIFQYNHSLYPLYMERIDLKEWTGKLYSINPFIIIFLVPVMTAITGRMNAYKVIMVGSFISAGSVFFMGLGESIMLIVSYQVMLSLGEAIYSPRLYDYTATIAPKGQEASYMALSKVPMFFAKVGAGPATGLLLANLCPPEGPRNTELMWIIVGASTMISPITLFLGRKWLDVEGRRKGPKAGEAAA